jgi:asparagine synthase (glutamine-hydrolysing)
MFDTGGAPSFSRSLASRTPPFPFSGSAFHADALCQMCGIAGVAGAGHKHLLADALARMMETLGHRGPDDAGTYVETGIALGHRRLSIIDLAGGHQPIRNEDGSLWVVCNGEIYNYRDLRKRLSARGHVFSTHSDSEVIVHLYEEHGEACVDHLRGMFAFALWDGRNQRLLLARDHIGQKPLFYAVHEGILYFASEIKGILAAVPSLRRVNRAALDQYLALRIIVSPSTMFSGVWKLPPAHVLSFDINKGAAIRRYWSISFEPKWVGSEEALIATTEERLIESLQLHTLADVPIGAFLSGGLDSTLVVALLRAHGLAPELHTFSAGVPFRQFDELGAAKLVAERYGTTHHEIVLSASILCSLADVVWHLDEPSDLLSVCQYQISRFAREEVKVVLGGDGGDELFGGYDRYLVDGLVSHYSRIPAPVRQVLFGWPLAFLPEGNWYKSLVHKLKW